MNNTIRWIKFLGWKLGSLVGIGEGFPDWKKRGKFIGVCSVSWDGPDKYHYTPDPASPLTFYRGSTPDVFTPTGEVIVAREMETDGGSVTKMASLVGLTPFTYLPGFIVHDWLFEDHHLNGVGDRRESNLILLEAMYTLMMDGICPQNNFHAELVWDGVMSPKGEDAWNVGWKL